MLLGVPCPVPVGEVAPAWVVPHARAPDKIGVLVFAVTPSDRAGVMGREGVAGCAALLTSEVGACSEFEVCSRWPETSMEW